MVTQDQLRKLSDKELLTYATQLKILVRVRTGVRLNTNYNRVLDELKRRKLLKRR